MKFLKTITIMAVAALVASCSSSKSEEKIISKSEIKVENGLMTPEVLWAMGRLSDAQVSKDGTKIVYGVQYYSIEENKSNRELFVINADGTDNQQITKTAKSENAAKWVKNDTKIAFLYEGQIWEMNPDGTQRVQITNRESGIDDFLYSPDNQKILFIADVKYGERTADIYPDLPLASGKIIDDLMYKHWDEWKESVPHPFVADFDGKKISNEVDILEGEPYESPMKPFGGIEQLDWSPDSKTIAYTCRKKTGKEYAVSTNSDIYLLNLEYLDKKEVFNLTTDYSIKQGDSITIINVELIENGYDINPKFSPDGKKIAYLSMARNGNESDKNRLMIFDLKTGERIDVTSFKRHFDGDMELVKIDLRFDQSVESFIWGNDNNALYFISVWHGKTQIYKADLETREISQITEGQHDYEAVLLAGDKLIGTRHSMQFPNDLYSIDKTTGEQTQITFENKHILDQLAIADVQPRWVKTTDNKDMLAWVIFPPNFDPNKKYPTLLFCEGGPQTPVSQFWSYRWNFQIMAANDYIIIAPNRRGLYGFGQEWLEQISGDYGGQNMKDYLSAIDDICRESYVDKERLGCVGASYGGFSVFWLAGHHDKRFKAFIAHDGMFNLEQQYLETEEMWFVNWDLGGAYWEKDNAIAQKSYASSPHKFVDKWDTPILVIHGEKDYRILASQGMAAFNAAKLRGIPAELLIFPDENHWVLKPQNGVLWQRRYFEWLDRWLKE